MRYKVRIYFLVAKLNKGKLYFNIQKKEVVMAQERRNRRKGPDIVIRSINAMAIISWILIIIVFIIVSIVKPTAIRTPGTGMIPKVTNQGVVSIALFLMVVQVILAVVGIIANTTRLKRKSDRFNMGLIFSGGFAILGLIVYFTTM